MTNDKRKSIASALLVKLEEQKALQRSVYQCKSDIWELTKLLRRDIGTPKEYLLFKGRVVERKTLDEIGKELGITRERTRQIDAKIMGRLEFIAFGEE